MAMELSDLIDIVSPLVACHAEPTFDETLARYLTTRQDAMPLNKQYRVSLRLKNHVLILFDISLYSSMHK